MPLTGVKAGKVQLRECAEKPSSANAPLEAQLAEYKGQKIAGVIELPPLPDSLASKYSYKYHSDDPLAMDESFGIESAISKKLRNYKLKKLNIDESSLKNLDTEINAIPVNVVEDKKMTSITTVVSSILGGIVGYTMFFIILFYGMQVMRSVMEEKINRIVEVLISSVKPFELMMGKVIGVGLLGLTQIGIWLVLMPVIFFIGTALFNIDPNAMDLSIQEIYLSKIWL